MHPRENPGYALYHLTAAVIARTKFLDIIAVIGDRLLFFKTRDTPPAVFCSRRSASVVNILSEVRYCSSDPLVRHGPI